MKLHVHTIIKTMVMTDDKHLFCTFGAIQNKRIAEQNAAEMVRRWNWIEEALDDKSGLSKEERTVIAKRFWGKVVGVDLENK